jgi:predicted nucleic acid-binding protein
MTGLCFVDANVLVYAHQAAESLKRERASEWLDLLWRERRGRLSAQVISEVYAVLRRQSRHPADLLWDELQSYFRWNPLPVSAEVLRRGREVEERYRLSWWDSLIVAAAQILECRTLLTEDLQDGQAFGHLRVRNPFLHAVEEPAAHYAVPPVRELHRPRGRPRRASA